MILGAALAAAVGAAVRESLDPITDVRSTSDYRADVAGNLAARFVAGLSWAPPCGGRTVPIPAVGRWARRRPPPDLCSR